MAVARSWQCAATRGGGARAGPRVGVAGALRGRVGHTRASPPRHARRHPVEGAATLEGPAMAVPGAATAPPPKREVQWRGATTEGRAQGGRRAGRPMSARAKGNARIAPAGDSGALPPSLRPSATRGHFPPCLLCCCSVAFPGPPLHRYNSLQGAPAARSTSPAQRPSDRPWDDPRSRRSRAARHAGARRAATGSEIPG